VSMTSSWSEDFLKQLSDEEFREAFMADQVRSHIALAIRALRRQPERQWSQKQLGERAGKPQSWISKLEDPDYGQVTLQTLFEIANAFKLPLLVQFPEWGDWLERLRDQSRTALEKNSFNLDRLVTSNAAAGLVVTGKVAAKEDPDSANASALAAFYGVQEQRVFAHAAQSDNRLPPLMRGLMDMDPVQSVALRPPTMQSIDNIFPAQTAPRLAA
jgi:transcriptional regulator with XRE-family HTH domain